MQLRLKYRLRRDKALAAKYKIATVLAALIVVAGATSMALQWRQTTERTAQLQAQTSEQDAALAQIEKQREIALLEAAQKAQPKVDPEAHIPDAATDPSAARTRPAGSAQPGDLIARNTIKNENLYFGGWLNISPATVTISLSNPAYTTIKVSTPDGVAVSMPTLRWDSASQWISTGVDSLVVPDPINRRASWPMIVNAVQSQLSPGSYAVEIVGLPAQDRHTTEYVGRFTVVVVP